MIPPDIGDTLKDYPPKKEEKTVIDSHSQALREKTGPVLHCRRQVIKKIQTNQSQMLFSRR
jgi:hypothetical protein